MSWCANPAQGQPQWMAAFANATAVHKGTNVNAPCCTVPALGSSIEHPLLVLLATLDAGDVQDVEAADGGHGHCREGHGVAERAGGILHGNDLGKIVVGTVKKARKSSIG